MKKDVRSKGDFTEAFSVNFDKRKGDKFFILFEESRFPKDRVKKGLPPTTLDFINSYEKPEELAQALLNLRKDGPSWLKTALGMFITNAVHRLLHSDADAKGEYEKQAYQDAHNEAISRNTNNLSTKEK